jgi:hypothetical protein|tara:strand:- start:57 stop:476 length:420 start_codon:yes stop_codon:yes gene_type:complete
MPRIKIKKINLRLNRDFGSPSGNKDAVEKLGERGIMLKSADKSFSFKKIVDDSEMIINPSILDRRESRDLKNKESSLDKKFENENDPIYDLDENRSALDSKLEDNSKEKEISELIEQKMVRGIKNSTINQSRTGVKNGY